MNLICLAQVRRGREIQGLKCLFEAQTIVSSLPESPDRNLDYILSTNTLTAAILILIKKPSESLNFLKISQRLVLQMLAQKPITDFVAGDSRMSPILLQNYLQILATLQCLSNHLLNVKAESETDDFLGKMY